MKTLLKLLIAIALINAAARGGMAFWNFYQLKDAAERALLFGSSSTSEELYTQVLERAGELELPLAAEDLSVRRSGNRRFIEASYTQSIEFFPSYRYPVPFSFNVDTVVTGAVPPDDGYPPSR